MNFHSSEKGNVYLWDSEYNQDDGVIKMGVTGSLADRKGTYKTGSYRPGKYIFAVEIPRGLIKMIDRHLKDHFKAFHRYIPDSGTEYYDRSIIPLLESHLKTLNMNYRVLSIDEIQELKRTEREMNTQLNTLSSNVLEATRRFLRKINVKRVVCQLKDRKQEQIEQEPCCSTVMVPFPHQLEVLDEKIVDFYEKNDIGRLNWACGLGKSMLSIFAVNKLGFKTVLFGVSSIELQVQFREEILKIYPDPQNIMLIGGPETKSRQLQQVSSWLANATADEPKFVITTYHSCYLLLDDEGIRFDFKVGDEAHHLVGNVKTDEERGFRIFHKIPANKTLFMTATEKVMETQENGGQVYSMDDPAVFGELLDVKTVQWAIENGKITDYHLWVLKSTEDELNRILSQVKMDVSNTLLFLSCYMCLKTIDRGTGTSHLLLYTNTTADAELAHTYMDKLMEYNEQQGILADKGNLLFSNLKRDKLYNRALHSRLRRGFSLKTEVEKFKQSLYGVIPCVFIFGEGFDLPKLNGVCISGNMESVIRIIQYLLRPNRLERGNPDKLASIIIPYIETDDWTPTNKGGKPFENVMTISFQLRNVDANMAQKIRVLTLKPIENEDADAGEKGGHKEPTGCFYEWEEDVVELNQLKMRLKRSKVLPFDFTEEQDEYNYVREINKRLKIKSKNEYQRSRGIHPCFVPFPEEYFRAKGVWRDWYDFMGTETGGFLKTKEEWKQFCYDNRIVSLEDYEKACSTFEGMLPREPEDFYVGFSNIPVELVFMKRRR